MGMFDRVCIYDDGYRCSEGHDLRGVEFQTKDFDCNLDDLAIAQRRLQGKLAHTGSVYIYANCTQCPAFVQPETGIVHCAWVEFRIDLVDSDVRSVELVSMPTADWLRSEIVRGLRGPMPHDEATRIAFKIGRRLVRTTSASR